MPTTAGSTTDGFVYPGDTDAADVPLRLKALAESVQTWKDGAVSLGSLATQGGAAVGGALVPAAGSSVESGFTGGVGFVQSQQRGPDAAKPLALGGSEVRISAGTPVTQVATATVAGVDFPLGISLGVEPYNLLRSRGAYMAAGAAAGTYLLNASAAAALASPASSGTAFYEDPADYATGIRTTKYRLKASALPNATGPSTGFTFGLYPLTFGGAANTMTFTLGTVIAGSTFTISAVGGQGNSGDFTAPAAGYFAIGVVTTSAIAAGSLVHLDATLQMRHA